MGLFQRLRGGDDKSTDPEENWDQVRIRALGTVLTLNAIEWRRPQDKASLLLLGTHTHIKRISTEHLEKKEALLRRILESKLIIGVVAEPDFSEGAGHFACVWAVAEAVDAILFNGSDFLDAQGNTILDSHGNSEL